MPNTTRYDIYGVRIVCALSKASNFLCMRMDKALLFNSMQKTYSIYK